MLGVFPAFDFAAQVDACTVFEQEVDYDEVRKPLRHAVESFLNAAAADNVKLAAEEILHIPAHVFAGVDVEYGAKLLIKRYGIVVVLCRRSKRCAAQRGLHDYGHSGVARGFLPRECHYYDLRSCSIGAFGDITFVVD